MLDATGAAAVLMAENVPVRSTRSGGHGAALTSQRTFSDGRRQADAMATNAAKKVLVLCATGKAGRGIVQGLVARAFSTTCSANLDGAGLEKLGAKPVVASCVESRERSPSTQLQGKIIIDAAKASGVQY